MAIDINAEYEFENVSGGDLNYFKAADAKEGTVYIGTFLGTHVNKFGSLSMTLEHFDGSSTIFPASGDLGYKIQNVTEGVILRLVYEGKKTVKTKFGTKPINQWTVQRAKAPAAPVLPDSDDVPF